MIHGFATADGTRRFAVQFPTAQANHFYRTANDLLMSSLGLGSYLGEADDATDRAALAAVRGGINFLDAAITCRERRSERSLGWALRELLNANELQRDQFLISTKAGFLSAQTRPAWLTEEDVAGDIHCMHPRFLEEQLDTSRLNLQLDTIDIFYLHNPETQLPFVSRSVFEHRLQAAFERLERLAADHRIRWYGVATWEGFREPGQLDLQRVIDLARYVGGHDHHLRFIQLPFNLGMVEAYAQRDSQGVSVLKGAARAGIGVIASATLHQGRFARDLPPVIAGRIPGMQSDAARAIQFTRSTPGVTVALVGMSDAAHVRENLEVSCIPPLGTSDYEKLYRPIEL